MISTIRAVVGASFCSFAADQAATRSMLRSRSCRRRSAVRLGWQGIDVEADEAGVMSRVEDAQRPFLRLPRSSHSAATSKTVRQDETLVTALVVGSWLL